MTRRRFIVEGRVQGVFFRAFTRDLAQRLGIAGWVRNRADGSVEAEAEGPEAAMSEFIEGLRQGPSAARVSAVREEPPTGALGERTFKIVY